MSCMGQVKNFNGEKGFGFIIGPDGTDIFLHIKKCTDGKVPMKGDTVSFDMEQSQLKPGQMSAVNVSGGTGDPNDPATKGKGGGKGSGLPGAFQGTCKNFNNEKGFGFIVGQDGVDIFMHVKACTDGGIPQAGDWLSYDVEPSRQKPDQMNAVNVTGGSGSKGGGKGGGDAWGKGSFGPAKGDSFGGGWGDAWGGNAGGGWGGKGDGWGNAGGGWGAMGGMDGGKGCSPYGGGMGMMNGGGKGGDMMMGGGGMMGCGDAGGAWGAGGGCAAGGACGGACGGCGMMPGGDGWGAGNAGCQGGVGGGCAAAGAGDMWAANAGCGGPGATW